MKGGQVTHATPAWLTPIYTYLHKLHQKLYLTDTAGWMSIVATYTNTIYGKSMHTQALHYPYPFHHYSSIVKLLTTLPRHRAKHYNNYKALIPSLSDYYG